MQKFYRFWKKDFLNKLIVLVALLITTAIAVDLFLLVTHKSSGSTFLAGLFPTPTTEPKVIMTRNAETAVYEAAMATASVPPTPTTKPFTPRPGTPTIEPTVTAALPTPPTMTPTPGTGTLAPGSVAGMACLPSTPPQTGKVVEIVDGYTIKVLINGLVYTVRYLGIELPEDAYYARQATFTNGDLVFGKEITLIGDKPDKDLNGRLLRYVQVGETLVNLELVRQGLATTTNGDPHPSCADVLSQAEQSARDAKTGLWKNAAAP